MKQKKREGEKKSLYCKKCQAQTDHKHYSLFDGDELTLEELKIDIPEITFDLPDIKIEVPDISFPELDKLLEGWECTECRERQGEKPSTPKKRKGKTSA